ncbi:MAG: asparagine synthetase B family protein, partial [Chitinophagaceae bacterium]
MCGLAGLIQREEKINVAALQAMTSALAHRGPDGEGIWVNPKGRAGLGHRRLSILDPSPAAGQPWLLDNRYAIIHNGEIYNYKELRRQLQQQGHLFTTQSDTEVILKAYVQYRNDCLQFLDGMFAFAIWDDHEQQLFAARDRFGEKPFYYTFHEGYQQLLFASEPKALRAVGLPLQVNETALLAYLGLNQVSVPGEPSQTFYAGLHQLPPAHYLVYTPERNRKGPQTYPYWQAKAATLSLRSDASV